MSPSEMLTKGEYKNSTLMDALELLLRPLGAGIAGAWQLGAAAGGDAQGNCTSVSCSRNLGGFHRTSQKAQPDESPSKV